MTVQTPHPDSYTYRTTWSHEDQQFVATVTEFPGLSWLAATPEHAEAGLKAVVVETLVDLRDSGGVIPRPHPRAYRVENASYFGSPVPPPTSYPTFPMPMVQNTQAVNVRVGGGYYRRSRRTMHFWLTVFTCGAWAVVWIPDEILTGSGTRR